VASRGRRKFDWVSTLALSEIVSARNISFDRKPFSSGMPAIAAAATMASRAVIGM
jgi:hypothetical protein